MNECRTIIDDVVRSCAEDLFRANAVELAPRAGPIEHLDLVAVIGFSGDQIRGALGLAAPESILRRLASDHAELREDVLAEAANQLLGRIKNRLLSFGAEISLSLPMVLRGVEIRLAPRPGIDVFAYAFGSAEGDVAVWFDARIEHDLVLAPSTDPNDHATAEGELVLF